MDSSESAGVPKMKHDREAPEEPTSSWCLGLGCHFLHPTDRRGVVAERTKWGMLDVWGLVQDYSDSQYFRGQLEVRVGDAATWVGVRHDIQRNVRGENFAPDQRRHVIRQGEPYTASALRRCVVISNVAWHVGNKLVHVSSAQAEEAEQGD